MLGDGRSDPLGWGWGSTSPTTHGVSGVPFQREGGGGRVQKKPASEKPCGEKIQKKISANNGHHPDRSCLFSHWHEERRLNTTVKMASTTIEKYVTLVVNRSSVARNWDAPRAASMKRDHRHTTHFLGKECETKYLVEPVSTCRPACSCDAL